MKLEKSKYNKIDAISKFAGIILLAVSIDSVAKGNYFIALAFFGMGGLISILPLFIEVSV